MRQTYWEQVAEAIKERVAEFAKTFHKPEYARRKPRKVKCGCGFAPLKIDAPCCQCGQT